MPNIDESIRPYLARARSFKWYLLLPAIIAPLFYMVIFSGTPQRLQTMLAEPEMAYLLRALGSIYLFVIISGALLVDYMRLRGLYWANRVRQTATPQRMRISVYFTDDPISAGFTVRGQLWVAKMAPLDDANVMSSIEIVAPLSHHSRWNGIQGEADVYQDGEMVVIETERGSLIRKL